MAAASEICSWACQAIDHSFSDFHCWQSTSHATAQTLTGLHLRSTVCEVASHALAHLTGLQLRSTACEAAIPAFGRGCCYGHPSHKLEQEKSGTLYCVPQRLSPRLPHHGHCCIMAPWDTAKQRVQTCGRDCRFCLYDATCAA